MSTVTVDSGDLVARVRAVSDALLNTLRRLDVDVAVAEAVCHSVLGELEACLLDAGSERDDKEAMRRLLAPSVLKSWQPRSPQTPQTAVPMPPVISDFPPPPPGYRTTTAANTRVELWELPPGPGLPPVTVGPATRWDPES